METVVYVRPLKLCGNMVLKMMKMIRMALVVIVSEFATSVHSKQVQQFSASMIEVRLINLLIDSVGSECSARCH